MKSTLSKFATVSIASLAVLGSTAMLEPANAVSLGTCSTTDFTPEATDCAGQFSGPISMPAERQAFLDQLNGGLFNTLDTTKFPWLFDSKTDDEGTEGPNVLDITLSGLADLDKQSGTVSFANLNTQLTNLVLVPFGGNRYSAYYYEAGTYDVSSFVWTTEGLVNQGGQQPALSNFNVFTQTIPTPALLPGLIGMGVAALRKRKGEGDESTEA